VLTKPAKRRSGLRRSSGGMEFVVNRVRLIVLWVCVVFCGCLDNSRSKIEFYLNFLEFSLVLDLILDYGGKLAYIVPMLPG
jgi:hypothetical protein